MVAQIVVDNCVPFGDVTVHLDGMDEPTGPASTLAAMAIINCLIMEVARELVAQGRLPNVNPTLNASGGVAGAEARMAYSLDEYPPPRSATE